jgi:hypothetical protein
MRRFATAHECFARPSSPLARLGHQRRHADGFAAAAAWCPPAYPGISYSLLPPTSPNTSSLDTSPSFTPEPLFPCLGVAPVARPRLRSSTMVSRSSLLSIPLCSSLFPSAKVQPWRGRRSSVARPLSRSPPVLWCGLARPPGVARHAGTWPARHRRVVAPARCPWLGSAWPVARAAPARLMSKPRRDLRAAHGLGSVARSARLAHRMVSSQPPRPREMCFHALSACTHLRVHAARWWGSDDVRLPVDDVRLTRLPPTCEYPCHRIHRLFTRRSRTSSMLSACRCARYLSHIVLMRSVFRRVSVIHFT